MPISSLDIFIGWGPLEGASDGSDLQFLEADYGLPSFQVELWLGFIFINFDTEAAALSPRLTAVEETIANYDLASASSIPPETVTFTWNWKVQFENNNDGYHANRLHQGKNHDFCPSHLCSFPKMPPGTAGYTRVNGLTHKDAAYNPTQRALHPLFPKLTDEDRHKFYFANVPPTLSLVLTPEMVFI
ncbi:MAG: hypothetical protein CM15mP25_0150 [Gammaproteobacteria bacterium]|nr:MAG: hypothetical protein CM15mP25_0150 [Gammaproteobacteria bacterium]